MYGQGVTVPTDCALSQIDPTTASAGALENHLNQMVTCLLQVWLPPMEAAGFQVPRPPVTVYTQPITTGCGQQDDLYNASYCAGDQRIYYGKQLYRIFPREVATTPFMIDMVMGHEFGHLLQARSGILVAATALGQQNDDSDEQESYDRRLEQQADCWAGMFLTAVGDASQITGSQQKGLQVVAYNLGDDVLSGKSGYVAGHGSGKARQRWFATGQASDNAGTCNTFTAPDSQVR
jgi:predicted metalloprotease